MGLPAAREQVLAWLESGSLRTRIPGNRRAVLAEQALMCGAELAGSVKRQFATCNPEAIAQALGVSVSQTHAAPAFHDLAALAAYHHRPPRIVLFGNVVQACREELIRAGLEHTAFRLRDICVAHELYHHLERGRETGPAAMREIAAHAFAACLLDLDFLPCALDQFAAAGLRRKATA
jgi:uncharacterized membrane-anchored protein